VAQVLNALRANPCRAGAQRDGTHRTVARFALALALVVLRTLASPAHADDLKPYEATYAGIWHGMTVAESQLKLEHTEDGWTFSSRSEGRGLGRLASGVFPPLQVSVVHVSGGKVQPQSFKSSGGSASKNTDLKYDWEAHRVTGTYEGTAVDLPLTPRVQDDGSVQLSLMVELLAGHTPASVQLIDKNSVRDYQFAREGEAKLSTPIGEVATVIYRSQKANSPRVTRFWCAPDRGYVPMKVEQTIGQDVQWTLLIQNLTR
jgi:Protein of unknown function (DUF3108)